jgi:indolepyruvate ferredoxin oxidoreductase beta subunit
VVKAIREGETGLAANVVIVGALAGSGMLPIKMKYFEESIKEIVATKNVELNLKAFRKGVELAGGKARPQTASKSRSR